MAVSMVNGLTCNAQQAGIWKFINLPYRVHDAERKCVSFTEYWLENTLVFEQKMGIYPLFIKGHTDSTIYMMLVKVTDDVILSGNIKTM